MTWSDRRRRAREEFDREHRWMMLAALTGIVAVIVLVLVGVLPWSVLIDD